MSAFSNAQVAILQAERTNDPEGVGYSVSPIMSDQEFADSVNEVDIVRVKSRVPGADVFAATVDTEFDGLTDVERAEWLAICAIDSLEPANNKPAASTVIRLFGGGSATITALQVLRDETISRATEIGLPFVSLGTAERTS